MHNNESTEMYLETIYLLQQEQSLVRPVDIARKMGYSKPTVSEWMVKLDKAGLATFERAQGVALTEKGIAQAKAVYERHTMLTALFKSIGVSDETAVEDACRVEHYISDETFRCLKDHWTKHGTQ